MKTQTKQFDKHRGAALILVVVVTVLLAVIGVMFLMVSRVSEMETVAVADQRDLTGGVQTVVSRINEVLVEDLFGQNGTLVDADGSDEPYDIADSDDVWLGSLEPIINDYGTPGTADDYFEWLRVTDLWGTIQANPDSLYEQSNYPTPIFWVDPDNDSQYGAGSWNDYKVSADHVRAKIIGPKERMKVILQGATGTPGIPDPWDNPANTSIFGARADADGDGGADSRWVKVPGMTTSRGKDVFAAVRVIDNCAMLNLNAAGCFDVRLYSDPKKTSPFKEAWSYWYENPVNTFNLQPWHSNQGSGSGRYLTEINYLPLLRGRDLNGILFDGGTSGESGDDWYNLMVAKGLYKLSGGNPYPFAPKTNHDILMNIENSGNRYQLFGIGDELEIRNRYLVTSKVESLFEQDTVANYTLDAGGGTYGSLETPVDDSAAFSAWRIKNNPENFDKWDTAGNLLPAANPLYRYDRRHVCTFYSFDRNLRKGQYPLLDSEFATLTTGWPSVNIEKAKTIFWPIGPATTDIASPEEILKGATGKPYNNRETRKRILHLLYALREYYYQQNGGNLNAAALSAAQVVANIIDFSDDDAPNTLPIRGATEGPFYEDGNTSPYPDYGAQANVDCTFINKDIIDRMLNEVRTALGLPAIVFDFGLNATDIVFGYERQPFISEVYVRWDGSVPAPHVTGFAIELLNPYDKPINIAGWTLKIGTAVNHTFASSASNPVTEVPAFSTTTGLGRLVIQINSTGSVPGGSFGYDITGITWTTLESDLISREDVVLLKAAPNGIGNLNVDTVDDTDIQQILGYSAPSGGAGNNALKRDDSNWKFVQAEYAVQRDFDGNYTDTLGQANNVNLSIDGFQLAAADDQNPLCRWHELEVLGLYGNSPESSDPNDVITQKIASATASSRHFDLTVSSNNPLEYLCTMNRPDIGSLPGRININTAPVHVIAAAIPPTLADPNAADPTKTVTFSALQLAQEIVNNRPYTTLSDLLKINRFNQYAVGGTWANENVGQQSIDDDIEERDWILSNLANKFTVRSDVFTAYILVRLGEDGPQRRMIAIFDRSNVWNLTDRPKLVALHPVPDPQ